MLAHGLELWQALSLLAVPLGILLAVATLLLTGPRWLLAGAPHRRFALGASLVAVAFAGVAYAAAFESMPEDAQAESVLGTLVLALAVVAFLRARAKP